MRRLAVSMAVAALLVAARPAVAGAGAIDLRIVYRASEAAKPRVFTLRCDPARGTVPQPARACRELRALGPDAFAPLPPGKACAQLYGGPQTAVVTGSYYGRRVWARLTRVDGCAIGRWNGLSFLLPAARS